MPYNMVFGPAFTRCIKALKKRFPSIKRDVELAIEILLENPIIGSVIPGASGVRKLRVYLLLLYAKSDRETVSLREIEALIKDLR